jgi:hypothetical protein
MHKIETISKKILLKEVGEWLRGFGFCCSQYVLIKFQMGLQHVPPIPEVFANIFQITPHFVSMLSSWNAYWDLYIMCKVNNSI